MRWSYSTLCEPQPQERRKIFSIHVLFIAGQSIWGKYACLNVSFPQHFFVSRTSSCLAMGNLVPVAYSAHPPPQSCSHSITPQIPSRVRQVTHSTCHELTNAWLPGASTAVPFLFQTPGGCSGALPTMSKCCMRFSVSRSNILQIKSLLQGGHAFMSTHILRAVQPCGTSPLWRV